MGNYLKTVSLAGYRSYDQNLEKNRIDLRRLNIIIGANGAGKSNFISFLEMVSFMMTRGLRVYLSRQGGPQTLMYFSPKQTEKICGMLLVCDEDDSNQEQYSFELEPNAAGQFFFTTEAVECNGRISQDFGLGHFEAGLAEDNTPSARVLRSCLERLRVFHFNDTSINSRIRGCANLADNQYLRSDGGNIAAFLYCMQGQRNYYDRILRYVRMVMPQFFDFVLIPDETGNIALRWVQEGAEEVFGPHQFSDGALRFIALTTLLLQPPETAPNTIILDEPEIGLHPYAISILAKEIRMASKTSQVIVSTQSPLLLNHFSCEDIITADYDQTERKSVLHRHSEAELADWLENYSLGELWEKNVLGGFPV